MEALAGLSLGVLVLIGIIYLAVIMQSIILFFKVWIVCVTMSAKSSATTFWRNTLNIDCSPFQPRRQPT